MQRIVAESAHTQTASRKCVSLGCSLLYVRGRQAAYRQEARESAIIIAGDGGGGEQQRVAPGTLGGKRKQRGLRNKMGSPVALSHLPLETLVPRRRLCPAAGAAELPAPTRVPGDNTTEETTFSLASVANKNSLTKYQTEVARPYYRPGWNIRAKYVCHP